MTGLDVIPKSQISSYIENKLLTFMAGFWKSHGKRDSLITMLKKWTNSLEKDEFLSVKLMDALQAFYTITHDL